MLVAGESFNERKRYILGNITWSRNFIKRLVDLYNERPNDLLIECIEGEKENLKTYINELIELKRWFKTQDMTEDEGYMYPSVRAKLAAMTPEELEAWQEEQLNKQYRLQQAYDEYYRNGGTL